MRQRYPIDRRFIAVGLMAIFGMLEMRLERATSQEPPLKKSAGAARAIERAGDDRPKKDDAATKAQATPVELSTETVSRIKAATALLELRSMGSGSAACVSVDGFFVTNYHVVASAGLGRSVRLVVRPGQSTQRVLDARVIRLDEENDLALLKGDAHPDLVAVSLGADDELVETTPLAAFGYPFGRMLASDNRYPSVSVNTGTITALRRKGGKLSAIQLDASVNPGNSGGPVVDKKGNLIGIVQSGVSGARVNFAIPVSLVREFLSGPALVLRNPGVTFSERGKPRQFEIDAYAFDRRLLDSLVVELSLTGPSDLTRTLQAKRSGNRFVAEGSACPPESTPLKPILVVHKGRGQIKCTLPPGEFSLESRKFSWLTIDSLIKDRDVWIVTSQSGERFAGKAVGLPGVSFGAGRTTQLATADRIEMRLENRPPTEVAFELQSHQGPKVFAPIRGRIRIKNTPSGLTPSFDQPIVRTQIDQPLVIEAVVPEMLVIGVSPNGLVWLPGQGAAAGMQDEQGRYLLVNGQPWRTVEGTPLLPILFGVRESQIQLLSARPAADGPHNADRISINVQKQPVGDLTTAIIQNRAGEPTRVALAITFDLPRAVIPVMPPRSQAVLESHWPLDDKDSTRITDLGPAKRHGRTSAPRTVPAVRGNGLEIDRQSVLCSGVLPIDRTDSFSCSAWMKPSRAGNLTVFSRMNNGLRGFDLNYSGSLDAHLISSWDGNAIRVSTIERFDSSQWHHVAVTYDGSSRSRGLKIYLDGAVATLQVTVDRLSETIRSDFPFAIGGRERRDYYQGHVDEVRAYDRELTGDEVFELYDLERSNLNPAAGSTLEKGLVGHWPFEGLPADSLQDKSGRGHDGKLEADAGLPEIVKSDGGGAVRLGGLGMVDCGAAADFDREDPYSLGAWFKPRGEGLTTIMGAMDPAARGFDLAFDSHVICHIVSQWEGSAIRISTRATYPNGTWHHVVCTYDGSSRSAGFKIYVDGALSLFDATHDSLTTSAKSHSYFRIGSRVAGNYFTGDLDDVFVYGRVLSAEEAGALFKRGRNATSKLSADEQRGLMGFWNFEGMGEEAFRDRSGNGHHGQPDLHLGHSAIVPQGQARVARFRLLGGIDCGDAGDFERTDAFSAGGWFCSEVGAMQASLLSKLYHVAPYRGYDIQYDGETYVALLTNNWDDAPGNAIAIQSAPVRESGWRHVFFTYDGSSRVAGLRLYLNGELQKVTVQKDNLTKSIRVKEPFIIGSRSTAFTMRGRAAHVRLIPRELTAAEVRELAKADRPPGPLP